MAQQFRYRPSQNLCCKSLLRPGTGKFIINKKELKDYFAFDTLITIAKAPLTLTENDGRYDIYVNVKGGVSLVSRRDSPRDLRALIEADSELRPTLKELAF